jgi:septum formation protein
MEKMDFSFSTVSPRIEDELSYFGKKPFSNSARQLAEAKAQSVAKQYPDCLVLAGDTIVCYKKHLMGKPQSRQTAGDMIRKLSGRTHEVFTGIALVCHECIFTQSACARTKVSFRKLSEEEIEEYLDKNDYLDKAGAYGIQGAAMSLIDRIEGCFYNVVGLPVSHTIRLFEAYQNRKEQKNA